MKINKLLYGFCMVAIAFVACNEDLGNYDYTDVSTIFSIDSLPADKTMQAGDTLRLTPYLTLNDSLNSTIDDYNFEWYGYLNLDASRTRHDLGTERTLVLPIKGDWGNLTSGNQVICKAINKTTGIFATFTVRLNVGLDCRWGYLILTKEPGSTFDVSIIACYSQPNTGLSFAGTVAPTSPPFHSGPYKYTFKKNVFSSLGNVDLNANPVAINCVHDKAGPYLGAVKVNGTSGDGAYEVILNTDKYSTRLNMQDYGTKYGTGDNRKDRPDMYNLTQIVEPWSDALNSSGEFTPEVIVPRCYYGSTASTFGSYTITGIYPNGNLTTIRFYANNNWYIYHSDLVYLQEPLNRIYDSGTGTFSAPYKVAPYVAPLSYSAAVFFNEDEKRFMHSSVSTSNLTTTLSTTRGSTQSDYYMMFKDTSDPNTELVYMGDYNSYAEFTAGDVGGAPNGFAILKGSSSEYRCVVFRSNAAHFTNNTGVQFRRFYLPEQVQNAKFWTMKNGHLFCVTEDNRIYSMLWDGLSNEPAANIQAMTLTTPRGKNDSFWSETTSDGAKRFEDITSSIITDSYTQVTMFKTVDDKNARYWQIGNYWGLPCGSIGIGTADPAKSVGDNGKLQLYQYYPTEHKLYLKELYKHDEGTATFNTWTGIGEVVDVTFKYW